MGKLGRANRTHTTRTFGVLAGVYKAGPASVMTKE